MPEKYSIKSLFSQCKLQKKHSGFLLIEIMSAVALFFSAVIIFALSYGKISEWNNEACLRNKALELSAQTLEDIVIARKIPFLKRTIDQFTIECKTQAMDSVALPSLYTTACLIKYSHIELTVSWKGLNGTERKHVITTCCALENA